MIGTVARTDKSRPRISNPASPFAAAPAGELGRPWCERWQAIHGSQVTSLTSTLNCSRWRALPGCVTSDSCPAIATDKISRTGPTSCVPNERPHDVSRLAPRHDLDQLSDRDQPRGEVPAACALCSVPGHVGGACLAIKRNLFWCLTDHFLPSTCGSRNARRKEPRASPRGAQCSLPSALQAAGLFQLQGCFYEELS